MSCRILVLGCTGMLGHKLLDLLGRREELDVYGAARRLEHAPPAFVARFPERIRSGFSAGDEKALTSVLDWAQPELVVNCIGVVVQLPEANDPLVAIPVNALFPHQLAARCAGLGVRLLHVSSDCVFDGRKGGYTEADFPDGKDLYGRTKALGEVTGRDVLTLRTSMIGHQLVGKHSLVEWFLSQRGRVRGFQRARFSGIPTVEMARAIAEFIVPHPELSGILHLSADPISKYDLLRLIAERYKVSAEIEPEEGHVTDRSLDSSAFKAATGYSPPPWPDLIAKMHGDFTSAGYYRPA